jgi:hypothetical protein
MSTAKMTAVPRPAKREVEWPTTPKGWCDWWKALDIAFISKEHKDRCPIHKETS